MKILIDCYPFQNNLSITTEVFLDNLIKEILNKAKEVELSLLVNGSHRESAERLRRRFPDFRLKYVYWYAVKSSEGRVKHSTQILDSELLYKAAVLREQADIFLFSYFIGDNGLNFNFLINSLYKKIKLLCLYDIKQDQEASYLNSNYPQWTNLRLCDGVIVSFKYLERTIRKDYNILFDCYQSVQPDKLVQIIENILQSSGNLKKNVNQNLKISIDDLCEEIITYPHISSELKDISICIANQFYRRLYVDITGCFDNIRVSGIPRVVKNISRLLPSSLLDNMEVIFVGLVDGEFVAYELIDSQWVVQGKISPNPNDIFLFLALNPDLSLYAEYFYEHKNYGVKIVTIVYDLVYYHFPEFVSDGYSIPLRKWLKFVVEISDLLLCISKSVMKELNEWFLENRIQKGIKKIDYFYLGSNLDDACNLKIKKNKKLKKNFIAVSTIEPRKGYDTLLDAFERLFPKYDIKLSIVGREGWKCRDICNRIQCSKFYQDKLFWYKNASDKDLIDLYNQSDAYVNASLYEGFGLPVVEAAKYGIPLILRDLPVFRELVGDDASFFSSSDELERLVEEFIINSDSFPLLSKSQLISWEESVMCLINKIRKSKI